MMAGGQVPSLKTLDPENRVQSIGYCKDTYTVATDDGKTRKFWERTLRLKTDSSKDGPEKNTPALVPAGMMGDRADVIFANPGEIAQFISPNANRPTTTEHWKLKPSLCLIAATAVCLFGGGIRIRLQGGIDQIEIPGLEPPRKEHRQQSAI